MVEAISVIQLVWNMLGEIIKGYSTRKKEIFENHIEPLQEKIILIHKDYISGFEEVRQHLKEGIKPSVELIEFLQERRREYGYERQMSDDLARQITKLHKVGIKEDDLDALETYANAVLEYFSASAQVGGYSWFTDFIEMVQVKTRMGFDDVWEPVGISGNPQRYLLNTIDHILNQGLPAAFKKISVAYANLRIRLM